jgi:hypothetical protein
MDRVKLEELLARLASGVSRRETVMGLVGGALASVGALAETAAKNKKKSKARGKGKGKKRQAGKSGGRKRGKGGAGSQLSGQAAKRCKKNGRNCRAAAAVAHESTN